MSLYDHFRKEEWPFVERAIELLTLVESKQVSRLTDFLDPRQLFIFQSVHSQVSGVQIAADGGYDGAERVRVLLYPEYWTVERQDFQLAMLEIEADQRFIKLEHRDVMGAFLHIGLKREKFGDILLAEGTAQVVLAAEIVDFVRAQISHIHRVPVQLTERSLEDIRPTVPALIEKQVTVASPRIDALIGEVYHLSRAKALVPIRAGKVKVNWKVAEDPSHQIEAGDILSVAGFGRFQVLEVSGTTRTGRQRIKVGIFA
ncbi:RNA-binding protein [Brevibacillus fulvus]|uniref:RNA-binding protein YlmH n=1 Tax=Brevibacillus fulvus TaxID=1125967 RepID=A0A939BRD0_9BACL|nr:YlmH/Sll1252 family protein [Brevibacillus fulvus]MBM7589338.1 RNA-binding protein YlmH [Brevibacillus fulvus]